MEQRPTVLKNNFKSIFMKSKIIYILAVTSVMIAVAVSACTSKQSDDNTNNNAANNNLTSDTTNIGYSAVIQPILTTNCVASGCHDAGGAGNIGDFSKYADVKAKVDNGKFAKRVFDGIPSFMPPSGFAGSSDKSKLKGWVDTGAKNN
jgi:hypothetical protein